MKRYVVLFESFEESFDDFHQKPDVKSDKFYHETAKELIQLADQYSSSGIDIDPYSEKYGTATRLADLENDLIVMINDEMGEAIAQEFAEEADALLAQYSGDINEKKSKKINTDKMFKKDDSVEDNEIMQANQTKQKFETPGKRVSMHPRQTRANK